MHAKIKTVIAQSIAVKQALLADESLLQTLQQVVDACVATFEAGGKVLFCGNGGSAADAQHLAAELSGRFYFDRPPLFAEALHVNTSFVTAVANDYSYAEVYARMVQAAGRPGDVLFALSTSGNSPNILRAAETANTIGMTVVGMTGETGGALRPFCHWLLNIPSRDTPRIQECHMLLGHLLCELIEEQMFGKPLHR
ncbi:MAG TPA: D-sedoheptulose 7-phosphate isomerase [Saprospiraceae bacterium]|nr:D-sedoheptulose 7-phosphate isomerase [Saprospiraceae bacterium]HMP25453.1 D-sedoheptulose 7-phosphate isomerase [Saprospiraceae bacterium]